MADSFVESFIHRESFSGVIQGIAELCPLLADGSGIFLFPLPGTFQKLLTADIIPGNAFTLESGIYLCLGGNAGMVHARQIQNIIALHSLIAADNILQGIIPGMADMENAGNVRRRYDNGKRIFGLVAGCEVSLLNPVIVLAFLYRLVIILR